MAARKKREDEHKGREEARQDTAGAKEDVALLRIQNRKASRAAAPTRAPASGSRGGSFHTQKSAEEYMEDTFPLIDVFDQTLSAEMGVTSPAREQRSTQRSAAPPPDSVAGLRGNVVDHTHRSSDKAQLQVNDGATSGQSEQDLIVNRDFIQQLESNAAEAAQLEASLDKQLANMAETSRRISQLLLESPVDKSKDLARRISDVGIDAVPPSKRVSEPAELIVLDVRNAEQELANARMSGDANAEAKWLVCLAELYENMGRFKDALQLCEQCTQNESIMLTADSTISSMLELARFRFGKLSYKLGNLAAAIAELEDCHSGMVSTFNIKGLCRVQTMLAYLYFIPMSCSHRALGRPCAKSGGAEQEPATTLKVGMVLCAMSSTHKWWSARIEDVNIKEDQILVHFFGFDAKFDEWIPMQSSRWKREMDVQKASTACCLIQDYAYLMNQILQNAGISVMNLQGLKSVSGAANRCSGVYEMGAKSEGADAPRVSYQDPLSMYTSAYELLEPELEKYSKALHDGAPHMQSNAARAGFEDLCYVCAGIQNLAAGECASRLDVPRQCVHLQKAVALLERTGDLFSQMQAAGRAADVLFQRGLVRDWPLVCELFTKRLHLAQQLSMREVECETLARLGVSHAKVGERQQSLEASTRHLEVICGR